MLDKILNTPLIMLRKILKMNEKKEAQPKQLAVLNTACFTFILIS